MSIFRNTKGEKELQKVMKRNQDISAEITGNMKDARHAADDSISESEHLLHSLGKGDALTRPAPVLSDTEKPERKLRSMTWKELVQEADQQFPQEIEIEDLLTPDELRASFREADEIHAAFSRKTGIVNRTDLSFLGIAAALQTCKALLAPYFLQKLGYGASADASKRLGHAAFEKEHRQSAERFRDKHQRHNPNGYWINMVFQTVPFDAIKGSKAALGKGLTGNDHRLRTLGHDPILGWIFGTANILTDTMTLNTMQTYRISRNPLLVTPEQVSPPGLFQETWEMICGDRMNLPAAVFTEAIHLKSDVYSKRGLPVPVLSTFDESFATELYNRQYDALCLARDTKLTTGSAVVSALLDCIIGLVHGLFYQEARDGAWELYEARTRKILLISNAIASGSSIASAAITKNPQNLDIGSLLASASHLFSDTRFLIRLEHEFVEAEIDRRLQKELLEIDAICKDL